MGKGDKVIMIKQLQTAIATAKTYLTDPDKKEVAAMVIYELEIRLNARLNRAAG